MNRAECLLLGVAAIATLTFSRPVAGQCSQQWLPGDPIPSVHGNVRATTVWDPDGAGPAPAVLVVGGLFGAGNQVSTTIASFDGTNWAPLGAPPLTEIRALTVWNGLLVAAGDSGTVEMVATWNGAAWSLVGTAAGRFNALAVFNGNLIVGGSFSFINSVATRSIAQWDGIAWSQPGGGVFGEVNSLVVFSSLYVGGNLTLAGSTPISHLAIWNGTAWTAGASFNAPIRSLAVRSGVTAATSFVFAGGDFTTVAGVAAQHIARFTVSTNAWTAIPGLPGTTCRVVHVRNMSTTTFQLHAAAAGTSSPELVWRLNGTTWTSLGPMLDQTTPVPTCLTVFNGQLVVGLEELQQSTQTLHQAVRMHDGTAWQAVAGPGFDSRIRAVTSLGDDIVVGGEFSHYAGSNLARIARGHPGAWQPLGSGMVGGTGVQALCTLPNGDVVAGGRFTMAGGTAALNIARWNGSSWSALGTGVDASVLALLALPNGELIAGGSFTTAGGVAANCVARWNGTTWSALGTSVSTTVLALGGLSNGDIVATGFFTSAGGVPANYIARWNGVQWSALGTGLDSFGYALAVLPGDVVVVGGDFINAGGVFSPRIARWNGTTWSAQSTSGQAWDSRVLAIVPLPNGDYIAGGYTSFFGLGGVFGGIDANLARHGGGSGSLVWNALDLLGTEVAAAMVMPNGDVVVGGQFDGAGGFASNNVAVLRTTCPATAVAHGAGCAGSGGNNVLTATALPWTGGTFRGIGTGMPANAIALVVTGFTPLAVPMPAVLPQGVAGCNFLVSPDVLDATLPVAGTVATQVGLPNTTSLGGQVFYHQVVPLEFDLAGNIVAVTGTNGLTLTIGVL